MDKKIHKGFKCPYTLDILSKIAGQLVKFLSLRFFSFHFEMFEGFTLCIFGKDLQAGRTY